jgi:general secretion pathway protein D
MNKFNYKILSFILLVLFLSAFLYSYSADNRIEKSGKEGTILMNFEDAPIDEIIPIMSEATGIRYLFEKRDVENKTITLISHEPVTLKVAYEVFKAILNTKGLALVPSTDAGVVKIVPAREAPRGEIPTIIGSLNEIETGETFVIQLISLEYAELAGVRKLVLPLISLNGALFEYGPTSSLLFVDTAANIKRILKIIKQIDIEQTREKKSIEVIPIKYASAKAVESIIKQLNEGPRSRRSRRTPTAKTQVQIIAVERTNSLIIMARLQELTEMKELIKKIDTEQETPLTGDIHVYHLQYAEAKNLSAVLATIYKNQNRSRTSRPRRGTPPSLDQKIPVYIVADETTNSLIITASLEDYNGLKSIIEKLDIMLDQVLVEAVIAEVSVDKTKELGIELATLDEPKEGSERPFGMTDFSSAILNMAKGGATGFSGMVVGIMKGETSSGTPKVGAILHAYMKDADFKILSAPSIVTSNKTKANIAIKETIPYVTGARITEDGTVIKNWGYKDVGISLEITPQITHKRDNGDKRFVMLELKQSISKLIEGATAEHPATATRETSNKVGVHDKETVVIGGLMRDDETKIIQKVPLLGSVPGLGVFFRRYKSVKIKTNLLIFITPTILTTQEEMTAATKKKKDETERFKKGENVLEERIALRPEKKGGVFKSSFKNKRLVSKLIKFKIIESDRRNSDYVYFNKDIKDEADLVKRIEKLGFLVRRRTQLVLSIWRRVQENKRKEVKK